MFFFCSLHIPLFKYKFIIILVKNKRLVFTTNRKERRKHDPTRRMSCLLLFVFQPCFYKCTLCHVSPFLTLMLCCVLMLYYAPCLLHLMPPFLVGSISDLGRVGDLVFGGREETVTPRGWERPSCVAASKSTFVTWRHSDNAIWWC